MFNMKLKQAKEGITMLKLEQAKEDLTRFIKAREETLRQLNQLEGIIIFLQGKIQSVSEKEAELDTQGEDNVE